MLLPSMASARLVVGSVVSNSNSSKPDDSRHSFFPDTLMRYLTAATLSSTNLSLVGPLEAEDDSLIPEFGRRESASTASSTCSEGPETPSHSPSPIRKATSSRNNGHHSAKVHESSTGYPTETSHPSTPFVINRASTPSPVVPFVPFASTSTRPRRNSNSTPNSTLVMAPLLPIPATSKPRATAQRTRRPSREEEEGTRSRSRFPRLLWNSKIDEPSLVVLENYYVRTQGNSLPQYDRSRKNGIAEFSRALEKAGL